jgi:hypothetical protein
MRIGLVAALAHMGPYSIKAPLLRALPYMKSIPKNFLLYLDACKWKMLLSNILQSHAHVQSFTKREVLCFMWGEGLLLWAFSNFRAYALKV